MRRGEGVGAFGVVVCGRRGLGLARQAAVAGAVVGVAVCSRARHAVGAGAGEAVVAREVDAALARAVEAVFAGWVLALDEEGRDGQVAEAALLLLLKRKRKGRAGLAAVVGLPRATIPWRSRVVEERSVGRAFESRGCAWSGCRSALVRSWLTKVAWVYSLEKAALGRGWSAGISRRRLGDEATPRSSRRTSRRLREQPALGRSRGKSSRHRLRTSQRHTLRIRRRWFPLIPSIRGHAVNSRFCNVIGAVNPLARPGLSSKNVGKGQALGSHHVDAKRNRHDQQGRACGWWSARTRNEQDGGSNGPMHPAAMTSPVVPMAAVEDGRVELELTDGLGCASDMVHSAPDVPTASAPMALVGEVVLEVDVTTCSVVGAAEIASNECERKVQVSGLPFWSSSSGSARRRRPRATGAGVTMARGEEVGEATCLRWWWLSSLATATTRS